MKSKSSAPLPKLVETPNEALTTNAGSAGEVEAKLIPEAVKAAVSELMKQTFGTQSEELQDRMLKQVADVVPDFAGRELKTFDHIAAALRGIGPRDSLEGMLGAQMIAAHTLAMELMRRASLTNQTDLGVEVNVNRATKLLRMFTNMTETLSRYRGKVEQKMTVEHVHVYQGGQAIVGQVSQNNKEVKLNGTSENNNAKVE